MRYFILIFVCSLLLTSCKKEKLKDGGEAFIGKWKWTYSSINVYGLCPQYQSFNPGSSYFTSINPTTESTNYYIEFIEKGKVIFSQEQTELSEEKILWEMSEISTSKYFYEMYFNDSLMLDGIINQDTLMENRLFPFPDTNCDDYTNFFVRQ
jgi:hypothetical protein